jgi:hypothetical protein
LPDEFLEAWAAFGKVGNRYPAFVAWDKLRPPRDELFAGIARFRASRFWRDGYGHKKHFSVWLRARGWEDEYSDQSPTNGAAKRDTAADEAYLQKQRSRPQTCDFHMYGPEYHGPDECNQRCPRWSEKAVTA